VSNVTSLFGLTINRHTRDWHTDGAHEDQLPTPGDITQEPFNAGDTGASEAIMASSTQSVRLSNHEGGLISGSVFKEHAFPAQAGIQPARKARSSNRQAPSAHPDGSREPETVMPRAQTRNLQSRTRIASGPGFRRLILSLSKNVGMIGSCCAKSA
jgi:hypothetical protein